MNGEDSTDDMQADEDMNGACVESTQNPQVTPRMKHLLFGVRLSAASLDLEPVRDLEELARSLDEARARRTPGRAH